MKIYLLNITFFNKIFNDHYLFVESMIKVKLKSLINN